MRLRDHLSARHGSPLGGEFGELEDDGSLKAVQRAAVAALVELRSNPWAGAENRARAGSRNIADGRHLYFDRPEFSGRPRFRIVYRLEPSDGAPARATVYAIAERASLRAYRLAAQRWPRAQ